MNRPAKYIAEQTTKTIKNPEFQYSNFERFHPFSFRPSQSTFIPSQCSPPSSHHSQRYDQFIGSWFAANERAFLRETVPRSTLSSAAPESIFLTLLVFLRLLLFSTLMSRVMGRRGSLFTFLSNRMIWHVLRLLLLTWFILMKVTGALILLTVLLFSLLWLFRFTWQFTTFQVGRWFHDYWWFWSYSCVFEWKTNVSYAWFVAHWCSFRLPIFSKLQKSFPRWEGSYTKCWLSGLTRRKRVGLVNWCWGFHCWMTRATRIDTGRQKGSKGGTMIK